MKFINLIFLGLLFSCSHAVHLVHLSDHNLNANLKAGNIISAEASQTVFLSFKFDTNYVEAARQKLMAQCPNGSIYNILTRSSTSHGFFHWQNKIHMEGLCYTK